MSRESYSKAVVAGLQMRGVSVDDVAHLVKLSKAALDKIVRGRSCFTDQQLALIENSTGMTAGQLAMSSASVHDRAASTLMDAWAKTAQLSSKTPRVAK